MIHKLINGVLVELTEAEEAEVLAMQDSEFTVKISKIKKLHKQHLYSDVTVDFPSGPATIQFRDEKDRMNLSDVAAGATGYVISGCPETLMNYRTSDNVIHSVPAATMMQIAATILATKQAVVDTAWKHKDALQALEDIGDTKAIKDYDITTGWDNVSLETEE